MWHGLVQLHIHLIIYYLHLRTHRLVIIHVVNEIWKHKFMVFWMTLWNVEQSGVCVKVDALGLCIRNPSRVVFEEFDKLLGFHQWCEEVVQCKQKTKRRTDCMQLSKIPGKEKERKKKANLSHGEMERRLEVVATATWRARCRRRTPSLLFFAYGRKCRIGTCLQLEGTSEPLRGTPHTLAIRHERGKEAEESCYMPHLISPIKKRNKTT